MMATLSIPWCSGRRPCPSALGEAENHITSMSRLISAQTGVLSCSGAAGRIFPVETKLGVSPRAGPAGLAGSV